MLVLYRKGIVRRFHNIMQSERDIHSRLMQTPKFPGGP